MLSHNSAFMIRKDKLKCILRNSKIMKSLNAMKFIKKNDLNGHEAKNKQHR